VIIRADDYRIGIVLEPILGNWAYRIESYRLLLYRPIHRCRFNSC